MKITAVREVIQAKNASAVATKHGVAVQTLYNWRRRFEEAEAEAAKRLAEGTGDGSVDLAKVFADKRGECSGQRLPVEVMRELHLWFEENHDKMDLDDRAIGTKAREVVTETCPELLKVRSLWNLSSRGPSFS